MEATLLSKIPAGVLSGIRFGMKESARDIIGNFTFPPDIAVLDFVHISVEIDQQLDYGYKLWLWDLMTEGVHLLELVPDDNGKIIGPMFVVNNPMNVAVSGPIQMNYSIRDLYRIES